MNMKNYPPINVSESMNRPVVQPADFFPMLRNSLSFMFDLKSFRSILNGMTMNSVLLPAALICMMTACGDKLTADIFVDELTCEYLSEPLGIDVPQPRFAWKMVQNEGARGGQMQTAYQIMVASSPDKLEDDRPDLWNSGIVRSAQSIQISYGGEPFRSMQQCWWKVRVWNNRNEATEWSSPARFGVGIISGNDWAAQWIGDKPDVALREYIDYVKRNYNRKDFDSRRWMNPPYTPSPLLRKSFVADDVPVRAVLYSSALGYYEMWINGRRIGNQLQAPEWTNYFRQVQYQAHDITDEILKGENVISATLADGWCIGRLGAIKWMYSFPHRGFYATDRRLIAQLVLEYADGRKLVVPTDRTWKINPDGYILMADNFAGETIDARKLITNWNRPGFDDASWAGATEDSTVKRTLVAQRNEPIRVHRELRPTSIRRHGDKYIADFGQNIAGHCALTVKGKPGQTIIIRHGEWLNDDGSIYTSSLGHAKAADTFILSGNDDYFDPGFTYHGFQYAEISGMTEPLTEDMIVAKAVSSDPAVVGTFECSSQALNKLYENILWTQRNNMFSVLHDNPSRDERTAAAGDVQIFAQAAIFNMNMAAFFSKYVEDMNEMGDNGQFFSMYPSLKHEGFWGGWVGAPGWAEAGFIVPWRLYENYADLNALGKLYLNMKSHIDATRNENPSLIWKIRHNHNGDWLNANTISRPPDTTYNTSRGATPDDMFATAFFASSTRLLANIADKLGNDADAVSYYNDLADKIKEAFIAEYVHEDGTVEGDSQGAYSLALYYDLIPKDLREKAFGHLLRCLEEYDCRLSTGFITTPMMMDELVRFGRVDIAYRLLESERFPSWLYLVKIGATTVWERWDGWIPGRGFQSDGMNSLDHVAFGAVSEWMFRYILGINPDINRPGYEHFVIHPRPGGTLTWAKGSYNSIRGEIVVSWKISNSTFVLDVSIPANTTATIILPNGKTHEAGSGKHRFEAQDLEAQGVNAQKDQPSAGRL
jgi:alpha-L-rhamnosidase